MRYEANHKEESRERILTSAARQFRARGTEAVRVSDVMRAAGMTHGGFYKHFADKDQLLLQAVETALSEIATRIATMIRGKPRGEALRAVIDFYLSDGHVQNPDAGCPVAALGTEMVRFPRPMRAAVTRALDQYAEALEYLMPGETKERRKGAFRVLFSSMAGCVMTARATGNKEARRQMLTDARALFTAAFCEDFSTSIPRRP